MSSTRTAAAVPQGARGGQQQRSSPTSVASPMNAGQQQPHQQRQQQPTKPKVTPPPRRNKPLSSSKKQHPEMVVEKRIVDELLLVCGVIGSNATTVDEATGQTTEKFVPVTDCLNWLQDLQRALRRDHETYRPISLLLGQWRIVSQKLLPLVMSCRYDKAMVLTVCKILVILTKPLSEDAKRAGRLTVDVKSKKVDESVIQEQIVLRENAIAQSDLLMEYKKLFVRHSSHHYAFQNQKDKQIKANNKSEGTGLLSVFTSLLAEPLSKMGSSRTSADHLTIELVLHLMRNLLSITPLNTFGSTEKAQHAAQLHREFLVLLEEEMVFDVLTCVGQEVERRENSGYNLLLMEILSCLLRGQDPTDVALSAVESAAPIFETKVMPSKKKSAKTQRTITTARASSAGSSSLKAHLQSERQKLQLSASSRHSHFGGTLRISKGDGKQVYVSASDYLARKSQTGGGASAIGQPVRRKNKKAEVFVGSGKASTLHSRPGASASLSREIAGPTSKRSKAALNSFCEKFVAQCYGPVMKSLKNEFRRDSNRLEDGDRTLFFRIVWFFHQWFRVMRRNASKKKGSGEESSAQNLIFTMDVFMFNLVLNSTDEFFEHKKPAELAQTVSLYTEMIHMLHAMYESKDSTEHMMALGLMDRIFYAAEPLDRLPRLLSRWTPGMFSREYLCDLIECSHITWKLLDVNAKKCIESFPSDKLSTKRPKDAVERMNLTASEFDMEIYFTRKFVSNQIVFMYTQLLSQYAVNASGINRHIVAYFIRLCKMEIKSGDGDEMEFDDALGKNELAAKTSTMEPMLYNIGLLTVLNTILNDKTIRDKNDFEALIVFTASFMKRFAKASEENPMLYVEALFKHPVPHRFCELSTNVYVNEELRMIAVRDLLLEDQQRFEQAEGNDDEENEEEENEVTYDDDEEDEIEFNDDAMAADELKRRRLRSLRKRRKLNEKKSKSNKHAADESDSDESDEDEREENEFSGDDNDALAATISPLSEQVKVAEDAADQSMDKEPTSQLTMSTQESPQDAGSPILSGKKRIRKSLGATQQQEDSDDEDFGAHDVGPITTKANFFEDDDDD